MTSSPGPHVVPVDRLDISYTPWPWPFSDARGDDIAAHFTVRQRKTPQLWNGRVLLMRNFAITDSALCGAYFETGFADFLAWRDWDFPDPAIVNCFPSGALKSSDGAYLLGVMSEHTANAGRIYFAAGTPDRDDLRGNTVDLLGNIRREISEETGLTADDITIASGWQAVIDLPRVAVMKAITKVYPAAEARERILHHLAQEHEPELSDIRIVRSPADLDPAMPPFITAYLTHVWGTEDTL